MWIEALNRFASDGTAKLDGVSKLWQHPYVQLCGELLNRRIREERERRYRGTGKHASRIKTILDREPNNERAAKSIAAYLKSRRTASEDSGLKALLDLVKAGQRERIDQLLSREPQRLWRQRLKTPVPNLSSELKARLRMAQRDAAMRSANLGRRLKVTSRVPEFTFLQSEFEQLWKRAIRRCEYPRCKVPGGRYFVGRAKECGDCRATHSRTTGFLHRRRWNLR